MTWAAFLLALVALAQANEWTLSNVDRQVDISTQVVKIDVDITADNTGTAEANSITVVLKDEENERLSFVSFSETGSKGKLKYSKVKVNEGFTGYKVELLKRIAKGGQLKLTASYRLTGFLTPFPAEILQDENQFVVYQGSANYPAAYPVKQEKTTVKVGSGKVLSTTTVTPSKQEGERVVYGPYADQPAFNWKPIKVHYENNAPFVVATVVERTIEVSHWGNIAVEEYIELVHKGAALKGPFSRVDYQVDRRGRRQPALQFFTTVLPASASNIYYRDEIGNISTSAVRVRANSVDVEIKPRYPLFGGWRTSYVIGYNVPSFEYLYKKNNEYALKMRVLDHIFDGIFVEQLTTKIVLPELVGKVKLSTPFTMSRRPDEVRPTYLDTTGRIVVVIQKDNLVADHIQTFTLSYEFDSAKMIREPLFATAFFFGLFLIVIIYVRLDFTLVSDPNEESREKARSHLSTLSRLIEKKSKLYQNLLAAVTAYKQSLNGAALTEAKKKLDSDRSSINAEINETVELSKLDGKATELAKYDKGVYEAVEGYITFVQKSQQKNAPEDKQFETKVSEARSRAESILASL